MTRNVEPVLSVSRRTDIPAFYLTWFMQGIDKGFFDVKNPFTGQIRTVAASPDTVHTIVFWSKNFGPFLRSDIGARLIRAGYHLYFHFSINSESDLLEPNVPTLEERLKQLSLLCERFGGSCVAWRFDPVCFYRVEGSHLQNNLSDFPQIADAAHTAGVKRCITSFMDQYRKISRRLSCLKEKGETVPEPVDADLETRKRVIRRMADLLAEKGIGLELCCEKALLPELEGNSNVRASACISGGIFETLFGGNPDKRRDRGQRSDQGCMCTRSVDIGSYDEHPCLHNCLFCYANPQIDREIKAKRGGS